MSRYCLSMLLSVFSSKLCPTLCDPMDCKRARLPCPLLSLSEFAQTHVHWVSDAIQASHPVAPFCFCPQSFPASGSFPIGQLFASGGQSIGASASVSVLPMNIQDWLPLGWTDLISLQSQGTLKSLLQHHSLKASFLWCSAFFMIQFSYPYMTTGKPIAWLDEPLLTK